MRPHFTSVWSWGRPPCAPSGAQRRQALRKEPRPNAERNSPKRLAASRRPEGSFDRAAPLSPRSLSPFSLSMARHLQTRSGCSTNPDLFATRSRNYAMRNGTKSLRVRKALPLSNNRVSLTTLKLKALIIPNGGRKGSSQGVTFCWKSVRRISGYQGYQRYKNGYQDKAGKISVK